MVRHLLVIVLAPSPQSFSCRCGLFFLNNNNPVALEITGHHHDNDCGDATAAHRPAPCGSEWLRSLFKCSSNVLLDPTTVPIPLQQPHLLSSTTTAYRTLAHDVNAICASSERKSRAVKATLLAVLAASTVLFVISLMGPFFKIHGRRCDCPLQHARTNRHRPARTAKDPSLFGVSVCRRGADPPPRRRQQCAGSLLG